MPAPIQQISSQEIFCELRLQKTQEVRCENMGNMISVHREECNYEGTEADLMGCQKPLRFCLSYFCISGKKNTLLSIGGGTILYMLLVQRVF